MEILRFDKSELARELEQLSPRRRVAFAAACAERLLPAYAHFSQRTGRGDPGRLATILDRVWGDATGGPMSVDEVQQSIDDCLKQMESAAEHGTDWSPAQPWEDAVTAARAQAKEAVASMEAQAEDAAGALAYALRCRQNGQAQEAAWAAGRAVDAIDNFLRSGEDPGPSTPGAEERPSARLGASARVEWARSHPLMQAELARQRADLQSLSAVRSDAELPGVVARIRDRARAEAGCFFG
jgi:uncharacterized protein YjaG (DUF416 family)